MPVFQMREWGTQTIWAHLIVLRGSKEGLQQIIWLVLFVYMK